MSGPESLRAAGRALAYWQRRQEVNAHNLANAETPGYRARRVFTTLMQGGVPGLQTAVDDRAGALQKTGSQLDLALVGEGHFVVQGADGEIPVRSASFTLDDDGQVIDSHGRPLLGDGGPIILPPGPVEIDRQGRVQVAGEEVGRLRVVRAAPDTTRVTPSRLDAELSEMEGLAPMGPNDLDLVAEEEIVVRQGYIEGSNVSALDSLIELTTIQRSFEAVQGTVTTLDSIMETVVNRIGRVE